MTDKNADIFNLRAEAVVHGEVVKTYPLASDIPPLCSREYQIYRPVEEDDTFINLVYTCKKTGKEIGREQFAVDERLTKIEFNDTSEPLIHDYGAKIEVLFDGGKAIFDKDAGLTNLIYDGEEHLTMVPLRIIRDGKCALSLFRAPNVAEKMASAGKDYHAAHKEIIGVDYKMYAGSAIVEYTKLVKEGKDTLFTAVVKYIITGGGKMRVTTTLTPAPKAVLPPLKRVARVLALSRDFNKVAYYGKGPAENFPAAGDYAPVGKYTIDADKFFEMPIAPADAGIRSGIRHATITDEKGKGILILADTQPFSMTMSNICGYSLASAHQAEDAVKERIDANLVCISGLESMEGKAVDGEFSFTFAILPYFAE
jgi:beta-galactosidase